MKNQMGAVCLAVAGLAVAGCSAQSGSPQSAATYVSPKTEAMQTLEYRGILGVLRDAAGFFGSWSDDDIRGAVDATCNGFANGETSDRIRDKIADRFGKDSNRKAFEVQQVMSVSVGIRCEEYKSQKAEIKNWDVSPKKP
jgi:hypothetical protein